MSQVIERLRSLDRKERFAVLRAALGFHPDMPCLDKAFREKLQCRIKVEVPKRAFVAMDYHRRPWDRRGRIPRDGMTAMSRPRRS